MHNRDIVEHEMMDYIMDLCYKLNDKLWASDNIVI